MSVVAERIEIMTTKRYKYRAYPTEGQRRSLSRAFGSARVVFNDFLAERNRLRVLGEKATDAGRVVVAVPRDFPSSQVCAMCGRRDGKIEALGGGSVGGIHVSPMSVAAFSIALRLVAEQQKVGS